MTVSALYGQALHNAAQLPLTLIDLHDWALATINGADSTKYLQGQLTADITKLTPQQHVMAAHCDAKGKMWSIMHLFHHHDGFGWIERRSLQATQLSELKKYAVFAKVSISADEQSVLLGLAGTHARDVLREHFAQLPDQQTPLTRNADACLLWFPWPAERFLIVTNPAQAQYLTRQLTGARHQTSDQWLALDIEAGYPILDAATCQQFLPQACNLQLFGGISFKKGCYSGQEMVARAKFRGANKRALYCLHGQSSHLPAAGDSLEIQLGDNWRRTGTVLAAVALADSSILVQAVLSHDLTASSLLKVCGSDGVLSIKSLPYSLEEST